MVTNFQSHYIPNTPAEQDDLLAAIGLRSIDELFADIPDGYRNPTLELPAPLSELEIQRELSELAARNRSLASGPSFLGAGSYHHFIPSIVKAIMTRGEFLTAYTPYQPEVSQGTLQVIFEFQTMISALYGMEVANAGMYPRSLVVEMPEEEWDRVLDVNVGGQFLCARAFVPAMKQQGGGRIICTASSIAYKGQPGHAHYAASKAATLGLVRGLARELAPHGITVNAVAPGTANTAMPRQHRSEESMRERGARVPLGRIAEPEDIANTVAFLASDAAAYITGQTMVVNGGDFMI